jgi:hypothetical protein
MIKTKRSGDESRRGAYSLTFADLPLRIVTTPYFFGVADSEYEFGVI